MSVAVVIPEFWAREDAFNGLVNTLATVYYIPVHIFPVVFSSVNFYLLTDTIGYMSDVWICVLSLLYIGVAYLYTVESGHPVYEFLTFDPEDGMSTGLLVGGAAGAFVV